MRLRTLTAVHFRNLTSATLEPGPGLTVLFGDNGQGKTNVLEAIYYLATLRSFRTNQGTDLIQTGESSARLSATVDARALERLLEVTIVPGKRALKIDGKSVRRASEALGGIGVVLFVPEDLALPRAAPAARRRFLDMAVWACHRPYLDEATTFLRTLKQRNAHLRGRNIDPLLLDTLDDALAKAGARLVIRRRAMAARLAPLADAAFQALHGSHRVGLAYESHPEIMAADAEQDIQHALGHGLSRRRAVDVRRRHTTYGPQTDDLAISLGGRLAREHASQGQVRSLVLALKLAELKVVEDDQNELPVLLLDDVPSELDPHRRKLLFDTVSRLACQTIISVADASVVPASSHRVDYQIAGGTVRGVASAHR